MSSLQSKIVVHISKWVVIRYLINQEGKIYAHKSNPFKAWSEKCALKMLNFQWNDFNQYNWEFLLLNKSENVANENSNSNDGRKVSPRKMCYARYLVFKPFDHSRDERTRNNFFFKFKLNFSCCLLVWLSYSFLVKFKFPNEVAEEWRE